MFKKAIGPAKTGAAATSDKRVCESIGDTMAKDVAEVDVLS